MARGDLLFYRTQGTVLDDVIRAATGGPFVHVEVDAGDGTSYGAQSSGIGHYRRLSGAHLAAWPTSAHVSPIALNRLLAWAAMQVGRPYGWLDCLDGGLHDVVTGLPTALPLGLPDLLRGVLVAAPILTIPGAWDCSSFAVRCLTVAGYTLPEGMSQTPDDVTPEALARVLGVS